MKRKVIQIAESTQLISLPRKWAKKYNIKKGEEIDVEEEGDKLVISAKGTAAKPMKTSIDITGFEEIIPRVMHSFYKNGFDEVEIFYKKLSSIENLQRILRDEMIGFEIIEQNPTRCIVRTIAGSHSSEFNVVLRRTFIVLKLMLEGLVNAIEKEDNSQIKNLRYHEITNNKYTAFCRRIINKFGIKSDYPTIEYCIIEWLEKIADQAKYLCDYIMESKENIKTSKETVNFYKRLLNLFKMSYELYYNFDMKKLKQAFIERKKIIKDTLPLFSKTEAKRHIHYIVSIVQILADIVGFEHQLAIKKSKETNIP